MSVLVVQPAAAALHCFTNGDRHFDRYAPAKVMDVAGVRSAYLVTARRSPAQWCLVIHPVMAVEQGNAESLHGLAGAVGRQLGFDAIRLHYAAERGGHSLSAGFKDWLA